MDDVVSTHLGSTTKTSWGDGRRQADVGDTEDRRHGGLPLVLGAGRLGKFEWNSSIRAGSRMSSLGIHDLSSGPYPSQSTRYSSRPPRRWESKMVLTS